MDARQLRKLLQLAALEMYSIKIDNSDKYELGLILDIEPDKITPAVRNRIDRVLLDMIDKAESKV